MKQIINSSSISNSYQRFYYGHLNGKLWWFKDFCYYKNILVLFDELHQMVYIVSSTFHKILKWNGFLRAYLFQTHMFLLD